MTAPDPSHPSGSLAESIERLERLVAEASPADRPAVFEARELLRVVTTRLEGSRWRALRPLCDTLQSLFKDLVGSETKVEEVVWRTARELTSYLERAIEPPVTGFSPGRAPHGDLEPARVSFRMVNESMLGEILIKQEKITREQLDEALALQKVSRKRLGEVLIAMRAVDLETLESAFHAQRQETLRLTEEIAPSSERGGGLRLRALPPHRGPSA